MLYIKDSTKTIQRQQLSSNAMGRLSSQQRRTSTIVRDNAVHDEYNQLVAQLGELANVVSRNYIYDRIRVKTGLCVKTIAYVLNHTKSINISGDA